MSDLTTFRDHCHKMAAAEHKPECPSLGAAKWDWPPPPPPPPCDGCNPPADRELFERLAGEVDDYLGRSVDVDLFGQLSEMPTTAEEPA